MALTRPLANVAAVALIAIGLVVLLPDCASACTCAYAGAPGELTYSSAVFSGGACVRTSAGGSAVGEQGYEAEGDEGHHANTSERSSKCHPANILRYSPNLREGVFSEVRVADPA